MARAKYLIGLSVTYLLCACSVSTTDIYLAAGTDILCHPDNGNLGNTVVLPEVAWRHNQKDREEREAMFTHELQRIFTQLPCGQFSSPESLREIDDWSAMAESELLKQYAGTAVDTLVLLRIEELTPKLALTFSLPYLWTGSNEADFRIRALDVNLAEVIIDARVKRSTGGPFNIRPAQWSGEELYAGLSSIIGIEPDDAAQ